MSAVIDPGMSVILSESTWGSGGAASMSVYDAAVDFPRWKTRAEGGDACSLV